MNGRIDTSAVELKMDGGCHAWNDENKALIRRIFHQCSYPYTKDIPTVFSKYNRLNVGSSNVALVTYTSSYHMLIFLKTMQSGALAASLRSNNYVIACKIRKFNNPTWINVHI